MSSDNGFTLITQTDFARKHGLSIATVYNYAKQGKFVTGARRQIAENHPVTVANLRIAMANSQKFKRAESVKNTRKKPLPYISIPGTPTDDYSPMLDDDDSAGMSMDMIEQKGYEDVRLKKVQADLKTLEYAQRLEVLVDADTVQRVFGAFRDTLLNDLIYMPSEAADMLYMIARSTDDSRKIEEELSTRIAEIVAKAKRAAEQIVPRGVDQKYVMIEPDGD